MAQQVEMTSGPLPAATELERYEQILPGLANRIVSMAESQHAHRITMEAHVVKSMHRRSWAGLLSGLVVALGGLYAAAWVAANASAAAGAVIGTVDLIGLVSVFVYQRRKDE